jgi:1-acyl-sn-glycerol-3-phosphate acyltransferase
MLYWLPKPLIGIFSILCYALNLLFFSILIYIAAFIKIGRPGEKRRRYFENTSHFFAKMWAYVNDGLMKLTQKTTWEIDNTDILSSEQWYLLISNHQSWADIIILEKIFVRKIPMLKFFLKKELRWLPIVGTSCWVLNFPFMKRYNKAFLEKHPELKGKDLETTQKACEIFKATPTTLMNFVEGTRFTEKKRQIQDSPFRYLLKPKAGGVAFTLSAMNGMLKELINVTIIYHGEKRSAWDFFCGRIEKISIKFDVTPIGPELLGAYQDDPLFRAYFQNWLNEIWLQKDKLIHEVLTPK